MTKAEIEKRLKSYPGARQGESWKLETDLTKCTAREKAEMKKVGLSVDCGLNRGQVAHVLFGYRHTKAVSAPEQDASMDALKQYYEIITAFWQFIKSHQSAATDAAAARFVDDMETFKAKYPSAFARDLAVAWQAELERRGKT